MADRLLYDGQRLHWNTPGDGENAQKYRATSGMPDHQTIVDQYLKDAGPIPAGSYHFILQLEPAQMVPVISDSIGTPIRRLVGRQGRIGAV